MFCSKCGAPMADGAAFCSACGQAFSIAARPARAPAGNAPAIAFATRVEYGGFWLRLVAYLIDGVVMALGIVLVLIPLIFLTGLGALLSQIHFIGYIMAGFTEKKRALHDMIAGCVILRRSD